MFVFLTTEQYEIMCDVNKLSQIKVSTGCFAGHATEEPVLVSLSFLKYVFFQLLVLKRTILQCKEYIYYIN